MVSPDLAFYTIVLFVLVFGVIIPVLDKIKIFKPFVSFRWSVIVVLLAALIGAIIDFSHLTEDVRLAVVIGAIIVSGGYVLIRTFEKLVFNGYTFGLKKISVQKGDVSAEADFEINKKENEQKNETNNDKESSEEKDKQEKDKQEDIKEDLSAE